MSFHFSMPRPRLHLPRRTRVVDEEGRSIKPWLPDELTSLRQQPASPATPTRMSPVEERRSAITVHTSRPRPSWEEQSAALWESVGAQFAKLSKLVADKSAFDVAEMHRWSEHLRGARINLNGYADAFALADMASQHASDDTGTLLNLRNQISSRILADALAATS